MKSRHHNKTSGAGASGKKSFKPNGEKQSVSRHPTAPAPKGIPGEQVQPGIRKNKGGNPEPVPIVGLGASAGGLEAFTELLKNLPIDTGLGFVLVQHLDPQHESVLAQLLTRATSMPVREVTNNLRVEANHVYVIPPNTSMGIARGVLKLQPRPQTGGPHRSVDFFLESLAHDQRERASGVILSGTATDGTLGLEAIKAEGGITFAQDETARYDSMPRSAIAAGCVDFVLSPENIANELARIAKHPVVAGKAIAAPARETLPPARFRGPADPIESERAEAERAENAFKKVLLLLRNQSRVDFSLYKTTTIERRITRRMVLNKLNTLGDYANFLRGNTGELDALYSDALISVTSFFRNREAFDVLKRKVFPKFLQKRGDDPVRVWVLGCSAGQEAYSIAMAFVEAADKAPRNRKLQVFATDLNEALLDKARSGLYAKSMTQDVSPERLRRFFVEEEGGYRVHKPLREMVVFARQNIISDPPFSRMDLISCRNLLIYFESSLQRRALPTFHYALRPGGCLFLGASESIGSFTDLFEPLDKKLKIYSRKTVPTPPFHLPVRKERGEHPSRGELRRGGYQLPTGMWQPEASRDFHAEFDAQREADRVTVNQFAPPGVLINAELQVLQFRGATGVYLEPPSGKASFDVLKMAREGLMLPLRAAINKAKMQNKTARQENVQVNQNGNSRSVNVEVIPLKNLRGRCFLILFQDAEKAARAVPGTPSASGAVKTPSRAAKNEESQRVARLGRELAATRDYLQSVREQHEAANEELQASNEEVQSANEELQSINEELETSKEELESTNEELTTVNEEMANRNVELNRLNSDLINLQSSAKLIIMLLGRDLTIRRFSTQAEKQFNLLATDVGRPIGGVRHNLDVTDLEAFITEVVASVREREREVRDKDGRWYSLRVRPYITLDNKVDGAVLVMVDIDDLKQTERLIAEAREHAEAVIRTVPDPLVILSADLRIHSANDAFYRAFKVTPAETEGQSLLELDHGSWNIPRLNELLEDIVSTNTFFDDFEVAQDFERIGHRTLKLNARSLNDVSGRPRQILLGIRDTSDAVSFQTDLRRSELRYRRLFESAHDGVLLVDAMTRKILEANPFMADLLGYTREELRGKELFEIGLLKDAAASEAAFRQLQTEGRIRYEDMPLQTKDGERREVEFISNLYHEHDEKIIQCNVRDITARRQAEEALKRAQAQLADRAGELEKAVAERTEELTAINKQLEAFVYSIAHDLRAPLRAMQGFSTMLVEEAGPALNEAGRNFAQRISRSAQFMDALLADLLAFSRIAQERIELVPLSLEQIVKSAVSRLEKEIQEKNARVEIAGPLPTVVAHEPTLGQVLTNLVGNALKFVQPETPPLIRLRPEDQGGFVRVWIEDNGIGIAPEHQDQIFRLFARLHGETYVGTGIGLAIVQKGIERMGGRVGVESTPGQGSRFWFELRKV